jgi:hypothetical protein
MGCTPVASGRPLRSRRSPLRGGRAGHAGLGTVPLGPTRGRPAQGCVPYGAYRIDQTHKADYRGLSDALRNRR